MAWKRIVNSIGPLIIDGQKSYIMLVRVRDPEDGQIWLISAETLRQIPAIADAAGRTWIETHLPATLHERELLDLSLAHWIVLITLLAGSFTLLTLIGFACDFLAKRSSSHWHADRTGMTGTTARAGRRSACSPS